MFNLPLTVIGVTFLVSSGVVALRYHTAEQRAVLLQDLQLTRQRLFWTFEQAVGSQSVLARSAKLDKNLAACLETNATGAADCEATPEKRQEIALVGMDGERLAGVGALFDWSGKSCVSTNCPFSSSATVEAHCADNAPRCDRAESLRFHFKLKLDAAKVKRLSRDRLGGFGTGGTLRATFVTYPEEAPSEQTRKERVRIRFEQRG
jgi:hypothetical protein